MPQIDFRNQFFLTFQVLFLMGNHLFDKNDQNWTVFVNSLSCILYFCLTFSLYIHFIYKWLYKIYNIYVKWMLSSFNLKNTFEKILKFHKTRHFFAFKIRLNWCFIFLYLLFKNYLKSYVYFYSKLISLFFLIELKKLQ